MLDFGGGIPFRQATKSSRANKAHDVMKPSRKASRMTSHQWARWNNSICRDEKKQHLPIYQGIYIGVISYNSMENDENDGFFSKQFLSSRGPFSGSMFVFRKCKEYLGSQKKNCSNGIPPKTLSFSAISWSYDLSKNSALCSCLDLFLLKIENHRDFLFAKSQQKHTPPEV